MIDWIHAGPTMTAAFLGSLVECVEALTIVLAVGTVRGWRSALLGTAGGLAVLTALVVILGPALGVIPVTVLQLVIGLLLLLFGLRRPLARGPENTLKLSVGVLLGSFGAFWIGEGLGFHWPGGDLAIVGLAGGFLIVSLLRIAVLRRTGSEKVQIQPFGEVQHEGAGDRTCGRDRTRGDSTRLG